MLRLGIPLTAAAAVTAIVMFAAIVGTGSPRHGRTSAPTASGRAAGDIFYTQNTSTGGGEGVIIDDS